MAEKRSFSNLKPHIGNNDSVRLEELIEIYKFQDHPDEWCQLRFLERGLLACKRHWVKIFAGKEKKEVTIPRWCVSFDSDNESEPLAGVNCPYCELSHGNDGTARAEHFYLVNAIVRDLQEDEPARKVRPTKKEEDTGYKDIKSKSWTPVRVIRLTNTLVARFQELAETNIVTSKTSGKKKAFDVSHEKYGCDINVKYKPKEPGASKYSADKVEGRTPLTPEEMDYLVWDLDPSILDLAGRMSPQQALDDFKKMNIVGGDDIADDDDDDDDSYDLGRSRKKRKVEDDDDDSPPQRRERPAVEAAPKKRRLAAEEEAPVRKRPAVEDTPVRRTRPAVADKPARRVDKEAEAPRKRRAPVEKEVAPSRNKHPDVEVPSKRTSAAKPDKAKRSVFDDDDDWNE
jgi:hypothetical protein